MSNDVRSYADNAHAALVIVCATWRATNEVLRVLWATHFRPGRNFRISPPRLDLNFEPPITFTIMSQLRADVEH